MSTMKCVKWVGLAAIVLGLSVAMVGYGVVRQIASESEKKPSPGPLNFQAGTLLSSHRNPSWGWPRNNPIISQDYAKKNADGEYHTGMDINGSDNRVFAAAAGIVVAKCPNGVIDGCPGFSANADNHIMQGFVILKHTLANGRVVYSMYAHLGNVDPTPAPGQDVTMGQLLGTTRVWCERCNPSRELNHVHFEIKECPVLHNPNNPTSPCDTNVGPCEWGYTPRHPDQYGYHDPKYFLYQVSVCTYSIFSTGCDSPASGGIGSVKVTTQSGCGWTARSNAAWLKITSGGSGTGSGTVNYRVSANTSASLRTGTMTIAGQTFTVRQAGETFNFTIRVSLKSGTVQRGRSISTAVKAWRTAGPTTRVAFTVIGLPTEVSVIPSSWSGDLGSQSYPLTFTVGANSPLGTYMITIRGTGGGVTREATFRLKVTR